MLWFAITIIAYFLFGLNNTFDKLLLASSQKKEDYITYSFFVAVLGLVVFILAPFGLTWPGWYLFIICLLAGVVFVLALMLLYKALDLGQESGIVPLVGGAVAIFTLVLSTIFLQEKLSQHQYLSFIFLVLGLVLITYKKNKRDYQRSFKAYLLAVLAAVFFATYYILIRFLFLQTNFITGFLWVRLGSFLFVMTFLLSPRLRKVIFSTENKLPKKKKFLFLTNQGIGGLATVLINYAVSLMSVVLVNALQGVQYVFVLMFALIFSRKYPHLFKEQASRLVITTKIVAIAFVCVGLYMLFV